MKTVGREGGRVAGGGSQANAFKNKHALTLSTGHEDEIERSSRRQFKWSNQKKEDGASSHSTDAGTGAQDSFRDPRSRQIQGQRSAHHG